jgi:hypothetical protein
VGSMCSNAQGSNASQVVALPRWLPARHSASMRALVLARAVDGSRSAAWQGAALVNTWSRSAAITCCAVAHLVQSAVLPAALQHGGGLKPNLTLLLVGA